MSLLKKTAFKAQPNKRSRLAKSVANSCIMAATPYIMHAKSYPVTLGSALIGMRKDGYSYVAAGDTLNTYTQFDSFPTDLIVGSKKWTIVCSFYTTVTDNCILLAQRDYGTGGGWVLRLQSSQYGFYDNGAWAYSSVAPSVGWHTLAITSDGAGGCRIIIDGKVTDLTISTSSSYGNRPYLYAFGYPNPWEYAPSGTEINFIGVFDSALPQQLLQEITRDKNPWRLFEPKTRKVFSASAGGGSTTTGTAAYGQTTLTGQAVTGYSTTNGTAGYGSLTLTGQTPNTTGITSGTVNYGQVTLTGQTVTGYSTTTGNVGYGSLDFTGYAPTVVSGTTGTAGTGALDYTGYAPTTSSSATTGTANNGALDLTGYAPNGYGTTTGSVSPATISFTGYSPLSGGSYTENVPSGSIIYAGNAVSGSGTAIIDTQQFSGGYFEQKKKPAKKRKKVYEIDPVTGNKTAYSILDEEEETGMVLGGADVTDTIIVEDEETIKKQRYKILAAAALLTAH